MASYNIVCNFNVPDKSRVNTEYCVFQAFRRTNVINFIFEEDTCATTRAFVQFHSRRYKITLSK